MADLSAACPPFVWWVRPADFVLLKLTKIEELN